MRRILGSVAGAVLLCAAPVAAQEHRAWPERAYVTLDLPFQVLNNDFVESLTFADSIRKTENVTFVNDYASTRGALFDVGIGVRVRRNLGVGITVSRLQHSSSASFDLAVPNPIAANNQSLVGVWVNRIGTD